MIKFFCPPPQCHAAGEDAPAQGRVPDAMPIAGADSDWREFRARLVAASAPGGRLATAFPGGDADGAPSSWAHAIPAPEKGCLLLAHPALFQSSQHYFNKAVIFLFEHNKDGSAGLILNRPTVYNISAVGGAESLLPEFKVRGMSCFHIADKPRLDLAV